MIIGPAGKEASRKGYPCEKTDCTLYREWGFAYFARETGKKHWFGPDHRRYAPMWITFGVFGCEQCKHFRRFDLYVPDSEEKEREQ